MNSKTIESNIEIFQNENSQTEVTVTFENETAWLNRNQIAELFQRDVKTIGKHINNVFKEGELDKNSVVANFATTAADGKNYKTDYYNLDVIISVGYRVKSTNGTQFRIWATQRLNDYLIQGYTINEKLLEQKNMHIKHLSTGISILSRALITEQEDNDSSALSLFAKGLSILDDYDHEELESKGITEMDTLFPTHEDYLNLIDTMYSDFESDVFAKQKDTSFQSSIGQIMQCFGAQELYPTFQEKATMLLYLVVKNHSFVDGNKRIGAACFYTF